MSPEQDFSIFIKEKDGQVELKEDSLRVFIGGLGHPHAVSERLFNAMVEFSQNLTEQINELFEERDELSESVDTLQEEIDVLKEELKTTQVDLNDKFILQILERVAGMERVDVTPEQWREIADIRKDFEKITGKKPSSA